MAAILAGKFLCRSNSEVHVTFTIFGKCRSPIHICDGTYRALLNSNWLGNSFISDEWLTIMQKHGG